MTTCYTTQEAIRTFNFYRGELKLSPDLRSLCEIPIDFEPAPDGTSLDLSEIMLLEPNSSVSYSFRGLPMLWTSVEAFLLRPLRTLGPDVSDRATNWMNYGLLAVDNETIRREGEFLARHVKGLYDDPDLAAALLVETTCVQADKDSFIKAIGEFREIVGKPVGLVTFTNRYLPDGRGISWPADLVANTLEAGRRLDIPCFHAAEHVKRFGVRKAMQPDMRFYRDEFIEYIGPHVTEFVRRIKDKTPLSRHAQTFDEKHSSAKKDEAMPPSAPPPPQDNFEAERYRKATKSPRNVVAFVDMRRLDRNWGVVRATLSEESQPTPLPGITARKLIEDFTPLDSHDIRAYVPTDGKHGPYRLSFIAKPAGRKCLRVWLGTGRPQAGTARCDVSFDISNGNVNSAYSTITSEWTLEDADWRDLGEGWSLVWITGRPKKEIPELIVSIMTATPTGDLNSGDGVSGVWLAGILIEQLDEDGAADGAAGANEQARPATLPWPPVQRDLVDLVDEEVSKFLKEELERTGDLYQWYKTRFVPMDIGLSPPDRAIADFILKRFGATHNTLEVGAGVAQCSLYMALCGVRAAGIEMTSSHLNMMNRLRDRIARRFDPRMKERFKGILGLYPDDAVSHIDSRTLIIVPSLGTTLTPEQERNLFEALRPSAGVILGMRMFFKVRDTEEERRELIREIQARGFGEPEIVFEWKDWLKGFHPDTIVYLPKKR